MIDLVFCAAGNKRYSEIARDAGYLLGARLPGTVYLEPLYFADQKYQDPNRAGYMAALAKYRPTMASVIDWEREEQLTEVLSWAEEAAQYSEIIMLIPKVINGIRLLPRTIGGAQISLGFSVPTTNGGTQVPEWEFAGWPVHLLGGSPGAQMGRYGTMDIQSVDGNMHMKMANKYCAFWQPGTRANSNSWPSLTQADGQRWNGDGPYEAFRRSCDNIRAAWQAVTL
jgi:hypothetical protein